MEPWIYALPTFSIPQETLYAVPLLHFYGNSELRSLLGRSLVIVPYFGLYTEKKALQLNSR